MSVELLKVAVDAPAVEALRSDFESLLKEHETLLSDRNAMKFELESVRSSSLIKESRHTLLEKENNHLKQELASSLKVIHEKFGDISNHFNAKDRLTASEAEVHRLTQRAINARKDCDAGLRELENAKEQFEMAGEAYETDLRRLKSEMESLQSKMRADEDKWRKQLAEATVTCTQLEQQLAAQSKIGHSRGGTGSKSLESMWKQKVCELRAELKKCREENEVLKAQVDHLENFKSKNSRSKPAQKRAKVSK